MKLSEVFVYSFTVLAFSNSVALAQGPVEMKDLNANFTMQLGGGIAWTVENDLTKQQSTVIAATPEGNDPFSIVTATTYLKVNPMAMMGASIAQKTVDSFLGGLCENYKCVDISARTYEDIDGRKAWIVVTRLNLQSYEELGVPEAVMIATSSPEGYMQLFSLHTAEGKAETMKPILIEAMKTIKFIEPK